MGIFQTANALCRKLIHVFLGEMTQSIDSLDAIIREAMAMRRTIVFEYQGDEEALFHNREVEPWVYGIHSGTGNPVIRAYQIAGHSETGMPNEFPFWRLIRLDRIRHARIGSTLIRATAPTEYNPNDPNMSEIFVALPKE